MLKWGYHISPLLSGFWVLAGLLCWKRKTLMISLLIIAGLSISYGNENAINKIYNHDELVSLVGDDLTQQIEKRTFSKYPIVDILPALKDGDSYQS